MKKTALLLAAALALVGSAILLLRPTGRGEGGVVRPGRPAPGDPAAAAAPDPGVPAEAAPALPDREEPMVFGLVLDEAGAPVPGAGVRAWEYRSGLSAAGLTGPDGAFGFDDTRGSPGAYLLEVAAAGRPVVRREPVRASTSALVIRLPAAGGIEGVVEDRRGRPVGGALVRPVPTPFPPRPGADDPHRNLYRQTLPEELAALPGAGTDPEGRFTLDSLAPGSYRLLVEAPGRLPMLWRPEPDRDVVVGETGRAPARVTLPDEGVVRFRVTDRGTGRPLEGVEFRFVAESGRIRFPRRIEPVSATPDGVYGVPVPLDARGVVGPAEIEAAKEGYAAESTSFFGQPEDHPFDVRLGAAAVVSGSVRTPDGTWLAGAAILLVRVVDGAVLVHGTADGSGSFRAEGLPGGAPLDLMVYDPAFERLVAAVRLLLDPGETRIVMIGAPGTAAVSGRLTRGGRPLADALVDLDGDGPGSTTVFTGADGAFSFEGLVPGRYRVFVNTESSSLGTAFLERTVDVAAGSRVAVDLALDLEIAGTVLDAATGMPIGTAVGLRARRVGGGSDVSDADSKEDGSFRILVAEPGPYEVECTAPEWYADRPGAARVGEGEAVVRLLLHRDTSDGRVRVSVVDAETGRPVPEGTWQCRYRTSSSAGTFEDGLAEWEDLPLGEVTGAIHAAGYVSARVAAVLDPGRREIDRAVEMVRANAVRVTAVEPGSNAAQAGFAEGDVILAYGDDPAGDTGALVAAIRATGPDDRVRIRVRRDAGELTLVARGGRLGVGLENARVENR